MKTLQVRLKENEKLKTTITSVLIVILASAMLSLSTAVFLNPCELYAGGVTGIAQIILHTIGVIAHGSQGWNDYIGYLGILNFIFLLPFDILAWVKLSKKYAIYTLISSVVQSAILAFSEPLITLGIFRDASGEYNILACVVVAAVVGGACNGLLMRRGATSGGFITLCQYLNLKKGRSVGSINLVVSTAIMLLGATVNYFSQADANIAIGAAISTALYTLICFTLDNVVIDFVNTIYNKVKMEIITEKGELVTNALLEKFQHGITVTKGYGAYSHHEKWILNAIINNYESNYYIKEIKQIDPDCFISVLPCMGTVGNFRIKTIDK